MHLVLIIDIGHHLVVVEDVLEVVAPSGLRSLWQTLMRRWRFVVTLVFIGTSRSLTYVGLYFFKCSSGIINCSCCNYLICLSHLSAISVLDVTHCHNSNLFPLL